MASGTNEHWGQSVHYGYMEQVQARLERAAIEAGQPCQQIAKIPAGEMQVGKIFSLIRKCGASYEDIFSTSTSVR